MALVGLLRAVRSEPGSGLLFAAAVVLVLLDLAIDFWFARAAVSGSDQPQLNVRGAQYIGREATVAEAIVNGRGKIRVGDTLWLAEGPDCDTGTQVKVTGTRGTLLLVERP
jgi:membrane protein implicated in regulation of membrane protease activity